MQLWRVAALAQPSENQQVRGKAQKAAAAVPGEGRDGDRLRGQRGPRRTVSARLTASGEGQLVLTLLGLASPLSVLAPMGCLWSLSLPCSAL